MILKKEKAITLVALIITIIVLLILAGVSLSMVLGNNGLINKAQSSVNVYQDDSKNEQVILNQIEEYLEPPKVINYYWSETTAEGISLYINIRGNVKKISQIQCEASNSSDEYKNWIKISPVWENENTTVRIDLKKSYFGTEMDNIYYRVVVHLFDFAVNETETFIPDDVYVQHVHTDVCYQTVTVYGRYGATGAYDRNGKVHVRCSRCGWTGYVYWHSSPNYYDVHCSGTENQLICDR